MRSLFDSDQQHILLLLMLILLLLNLNYVIPSPVGSSNLETISKDLVLSDYEINDSGNDLTQGPTKKRKRKRRKKKKTKNKERNGIKTLVAELASVFANFLSSVTDVPKDDNAIEVIKVIAESVIREIHYDNYIALHISL